MTLNFEDYLAALLQPLGVYDLRPGAVNIFGIQNYE